jgi:hypothetical protein
LNAFSRIPALVPRVDTNPLDAAFEFDRVVELQISSRFGLIQYQEATPIDPVSTSFKLFLGKAMNAEVTVRQILFLKYIFRWNLLIKVSQKNCDFFLASGPGCTSLAAWYLTSHWNIFIEEEERLFLFS